MRICSVGCSAKALSDVVGDGGPEVAQERGPRDSGRETAPACGSATSSVDIDRCRVDRPDVSVPLCVDVACHDQLAEPLCADVESLCGLPSGDRFSGHRHT